MIIEPIILIYCNHRKPWIFVPKKIIKTIFKNRIQAFTNPFPPLQFPACVTIACDKANPNNFGAQFKSIWIVTKPEWQWLPEYVLGRIASVLLSCERKLAVCGVSANVVVRCKLVVVTLQLFVLCSTTVNHLDSSSLLFLLYYIFAPWGMNNCEFNFFQVCKRYNW